VCCQVEFSASGWSLVQRSPTECGVSWEWSWSLDNEGALPHYGAVEPGKAAEARGSPTKVLPTWNLGVLTTDQRMLEIPVAPTTEAKTKSTEQPIWTPQQPIRTSEQPIKTPNQLIRTPKKPNL